ncbi:hypothetical protein CR513_19192, partial [Mucuna pruriens]
MKNGTLSINIEIDARTLWEKIESLYASNSRKALSNHLNEFQGIIDQMSGMGIKFEDEILGLLLLNSLPESWETFKVSITNSTLMGSILNEEMRRKTQGSSSQSEVLVTENMGRSQKKKREKSRSKSKSRYKNVECHYCHKIGHIQKHCFLWKKENKGKKGKLKEKDDDRVTTATGDGLVILRDFESVNFVSDESIWIIDSSATLHVTRRKEFFTSYTVGDFGVLKMGNDDVTKVIGVEASLWHRRLSHISEKWLTCLAKKDMLPRLKNAELEKCSHCMAGKQTRVSFKKHPPSRKSELLELVHSDVCGPLKVKSFSGALYFVTFIDDCSRKLWVYVLKSKDQVLEKFKHFQALVERQSGKKVKCIRSDNGGEYCGSFDVYCRQQGIRHEKTPPNTPHLNSLAERMNRTLIERGEALYTTVHVINLSPVVALNTEVPNKIWFGKDVKYDHLRVFGCKAFVHVPKDERS